MALYVYAIAHAAAGELPGLRGVLDQPVYAVACGELAALVSDCRLPAVRPERKHVTASQAVLASLNQRFDLLPMAFGTLSQSRAELEGFLERQQERLAAVLRHVAGVVEMGVRLSLDVTDPIGYLVERSAELKAARERMFRRHRTPTHDEKIRLGQLCAGVLQRHREQRSNELRAMIAPVCAELRDLPARGEAEIANLAVLVPRAGLSRFEAAVADALARFDDDYALGVSGPWPPHNFVQLDLQSA